jgi:galactokinase
VPSFELVTATFQETFGSEPDAVLQAPGRVNLIGEHTDYNLLPVLPIAIDRSLQFAARATDDAIVQVRSAAYEPPARVERAQPQHVSAQWQRYITGVLRELEPDAPRRGAEVVVTGDLPSDGGLSSSSAFSVGLTAALAAVWGEPLSPEECAERAIRSERQVGVETGGMDQRVIALAKAGHALRIDFLPLATRHIAIPDGLTFVIANSGVRAPKGGAARDAYNERVIGTRVAALLLADMLGVETDGIPVLGNVAEIDVVDIVVEELPDRMNARDAARAARVDPKELARLSAGDFDQNAPLTLKRYARHVLSEAARVDQAEHALATGDLKQFGGLLNESHNSLREDYRCSTPELDRVAAAMRKAGALGARLTGAGFGGYAVAAVETGNEAGVISAAIAATGGPAFVVAASDGLTFGP